MMRLHATIHPYDIPLKESDNDSGSDDGDDRCGKIGKAFFHPASYKLLAALNERKQAAIVGGATRSHGIS